MTIFVSRHRMTECLSCQNHIRVAADVGETVCPFCGAVFAEAFVTSRTGSTLARLGRTGLLAGALLGMSVVGGCDDDGPTPTPVYGAPADVVDVIDDTTNNDVLPQPLYGMAQDIQVEAAVDLGPQPEYGLPADQ